MTWPQATDYNAAVQNPLVCFRDDDLRQGQVVGDLFGLPRPHSGNFADVYQIQGADNQSWAIKCFTRPVAGLHQRYQAICEHLRQTQRAFMVEFHYLEEGICIRGQWYPLVKMRWVEGFTLNDFIRQHLDKPVLLERLAQMWIRLGEELRDAQMAHGDLQHGNVLLVPGSKSSSLALKLIDYDGMFVPALAETPSGEVGHPNYQHPQRLREGAYNGELDRFSHLLIYTALRCLRAGRAALWQRYDNLENLLFREEDFRHPMKSRLFRDLWGLEDREARDLVGHLLLASQGPLLVVPSLDELVDEHIVRPLSASEEKQVHALLDDAAPVPRKSRLVVPATPTARAVEIEPAAAAVLVTAPDETFVVETITEGVSLKSTKTGVPRLTSPPPLPRSTRGSSSEMRLQTRGSSPASARRAFDTASLMEPVVSILSRPSWLAALGAIALVSFLVVNVLVWSSVKPPPALAAQGPRLHPLEDVTLTAGHKREIRLLVERHDCTEPLRIQVEGLPADIKAPLLTLTPQQDTASLPLLAPLGGKPSSQDVAVSLWQGGERVEEQRFRLSVHPIPRPVLLQPESIHGKAGTTFLFTAAVDRHDCPEPLALELEGLPAAIRQESLPSRDADPPRVKLTIAADARLKEVVPVSLLLRVGDVVADSKPLFFIMEKAADKALLKIQQAPDVLSIQAGETRELRVVVKRGDYKGAVEIRLAGLPPGATAKPAIIPPDVSFATVTLETTEEIAVGRSAVMIKAWLDEYKADARQLMLTVERPAATLSGEKSEERQAGRPEHVTFTTVDHVKLVGRLYPGSKGKNGACVLMLPELGQRSRAEIAAWRRLAEALQAEGHTVLTFDFRGQGESKSVTADFWKLPVNMALPAYHKGEWEDGVPPTIEADEFSARYMPWLIHDIAAARMFLDVRHEDPDSPINSANLMLFGVGRGAALGSLWLASEGIRYDAWGAGKSVKIVGLENQDILRGVWLGIETSWKSQKFPVSDWVTWAHRLRPDSEVPIDFLYGDKDARAYRLVGELIGIGNGNRHPIPGASLSGMELLAKDRSSERYIQGYLVKLLNAYHLREWTPRRLSSHHSYWGFPTLNPLAPVDFYLAKCPGERILRPIPLRGFGIRMEGLPEPRPVILRKGD
ncbi:MAG TPA: hypothetical protein VN688_06590 [Gemmataceae bacterium]|nr:hypothetical protein [Gemmataceae bacterium]